MSRSVNFCLILCCLVLAAGCPSQSSNGFVPLFNGKDLEGWVNVNCAPETWSVRDGLLHCSGVPYGFLRTDRMYENYVLELEYRHSTREGNSGLFVHADGLPAVGRPFPRSIEVQILSDLNTENYTSHGDVFAIHGATLFPYPPHPAGWMRSLPQERRAKPAGEWNHYRLESRDGTLTLAVNGKVVTRAFHCNPRKGYICLESEGAEIDFRNLRIKELPSSPAPAEVTAAAAEGFRALFNGVDLRGWKEVPGNRGHWTAKNGILDYDGRSEAEGEDKHLWSAEEFGDFVLIVDWRFSGNAKIEAMPIVLPDGSTLKDEHGKEVTVPVQNAGDSGIYLRGSSKSQVNIWCWPVGSGEVYGYRTDASQPPAVRRGVAPIQNADRPLGEWNRFEITVIGNRLSVVLNEKAVLREAELPGMAPRGPIALQHHGDPIQFANLFIKELPAANR